MPEVAFIVRVLAVVLFIAVSAAVGLIWWGLTAKKRRLGVQEAPHEQWWGG